MDELTLDKELYINIVLWMRSKYAVGTQRVRASYLKKIFKEHGVLNKETIKKIMKDIKHQHQRACLVMINNYCYENDIDFFVRIPSVKKQPSQLPDIYSNAEISLMINAAPKPYDLVLRCIFNMGAGLRVSEIIKMSWGHIRWIDWLRNKDNYGVALIKSGKGSKDRVVNIPRKLMHDLYEYALEQDVVNEFKIPSGGTIFKFGGLKGKTKRLTRLQQTFTPKPTEEWKEQYVKAQYDWFRKNIIQKHCEKALNRRIRVHQLRHSRATYLYEVEKVPIEKIQVLLGHASMNTTMLYTRINPRSVFEQLKQTTEI